MFSDPMANPPLRLDPDDQWCDETITHGLVWGKLPDRAVVLRASQGGLARDFLWSSWVGYICISKRVVDILRAEGFTGWSTYPVVVHGRKGEIVPDYFGFAITGPTIPWDRSRSEIIEKVYTPGAKPSKLRKGMYFDQSLWDGSDFFWVDYRKVIAGRVQRAFKKAKVTNVRLTPIEEVEESLILDEFRARREAQSP